MRTLAPCLLLLLAPSCAFVVRERESAPRPRPPAREATVHQRDPQALGPYSASVRAGEFVFVSGKIGTPSEDFAREANGALDALAAELSTYGLALEDVVSVTVFLTDMARYADFNALYAARFAAPYPARACVAVAALPAGAAVEIQAIARRR